MSHFLAKQKKSLIFKLSSFFFSFTLFFNFLILPMSLQAQLVSEGGFSLPAPGAMIKLTGAFAPPMMTGVVINPDNPLEFEFMINNGDADNQGEDFQLEAKKLIKYFLATLTIPEEKLWVNLSPYEKDQMIAPVFGETEMGRDLLGQDYILKQLSASLMYPKDDLGKEFWQKVYDKAYEIYGTKDIPINTFNKIWIIPDKANIYENESGAFIIDSHLKVMLEEDYLALKKNMDNQNMGLDKAIKDDAEKISQVTTEIIREVMIPAIEKEVNEGATFSNLRQIFNSMILGAWYKKNLRESWLGKIYVDQNKIEGVDLEDKNIKEKIFNEYIEAFQKGAYNYLQRDYDPQTNEIVIKRYFSGGMEFTDIKPASKPLNGLSLREIAVASPMFGSRFAGTKAREEFFRVVDGFSREERGEIDGVSIANANNTSFVGMRLIPQKGPTDVRKILGGQLRSTGSSSVDLGHVVTLLNETSRLLAEMGSQSRAGGFQIKPADKMKHRELVAQADRPVFEYGDNGDVYELRNDGANGVARKASNVPEIKKVFDRGITPLVLINGPAGVKKLFSEAPEVAVRIAVGDQMSQRAQGGFQIKPADKMEHRELVAQAGREKRSVFEIDNQGGVHELSDGPKGVESKRSDATAIDRALNSGVVPLVLSDGSTGVQRLFSDAPQVAARIAQGEIPNSTTRSAINQLQQFQEILERGVAEEIIDIETPVKEVAALNRDPLIKEARVSIQTGTSISPNQANNYIDAIRAQKLKLGTELTQPNSMPEKESLVYRLNDLNKLEAKLTGKDIGATRYALSPKEIRIVSDGYVTEEQLSALAQRLQQNSNALELVAETIRNSDLAKDKGLTIAINRNIEVVSEHLRVVNRRQEREVKTKLIERALVTAKPEQRRLMFQNGNRIDGFDGGLEQLNGKKPIFVVDNGKVERAVPSEAIDQFIARPATVYAFSEYTVVNLRDGNRKSNPMEIQNGKAKMAEFKRFEIGSLKSLNDANARLKDPTKAEQLGGIDFNPALLDIQIKRDGKGVPLPLPQQPMDVMNIQGFVPIITDVSPATLNMPMILGQAEFEEEGVQGLAVRRR